MAWFVDRLGKSLQHLVTLLSDIQSKKVDLYLDQQGIDTTTPVRRQINAFNREKHNESVGSIY